LDGRKSRPNVRLFGFRGGALAAHGGCPSHTATQVMSSRKPRVLSALVVTRSAASVAVAHSRTSAAT